MGIKTHQKVIMSDDKRVRRLNTKKKFVADGVFNAELNAFLTRVLGMEGYAGIEIRATSVATEIIIRVAKHDELKEKGARRIREIKSLIEKRYNFNDEDNKVELTIGPLEYDRALDVCANVENLKYKLLSGTPVRMAVNNIMGGVMRRNAIGCEILVSGKVRGPKVQHGLSNLHRSTKERIHRCRYQTRQHETRCPRTQGQDRDGSREKSQGWKRRNEGYARLHQDPRAKG